MPYENGVWRPHRWEDYEIELIDGSRDTIGLLDEAVGASIDWGVFGYGTGAMALHIQSDRATDLLTLSQFYFRFLRDGVQIRDFMLAKDDRGYTVSDQWVDEYIEIALSPLDQLLKDHPCLPENGTGTFASPSLALDDGFKWIVDHVCGPNAYDVPGGGSRSLAGLTIAADLSAHATVEAITEAHKLDLFEFLQKFGVSWDVDWRVRLEKTAGNANQFVFETFHPVRGLDKTIGNGVRQPVILNDASGEVRQARRWRPGVGFANVVVSKDMQSEITDAASVAAYGRRELLADTNDTEKLAVLLAERGQRIGDEIDYNESEMMMVGAGALDIQPGDIITVGDHYLGIDAHDEMVQSIKLAIKDTGQEEAALTFGRYEKTLADKVKETGGGGGGGGGDGSYYDPILGLQDDAALFVPFSDGADYLYVQLLTDAYLSATGNVVGNSILLALDDIPDHDIIGYHTAAGLTPGHVLRATAPTTFAFGALELGDLPAGATITAATVQAAEPAPTWVGLIWVDIS